MGFLCSRFGEIQFLHIQVINNDFQLLNINIKHATCHRGFFKVNSIFSAVFGLEKNWVKIQSSRISLVPKHAQSSHLLTSCTRVVYPLQNKLGFTLDITYYLCSHKYIITCIHHYAEKVLMTQITMRMWLLNQNWTSWSVKSSGP